MSWAPSLSGPCLCQWPPTPGSSLRKKWSVRLTTSLWWFRSRSGPVCFGSVPFTPKWTPVRALFYFKTSFLCKIRKVWSDFTLYLLNNGLSHIHGFVTTKRYHFSVHCQGTKFYCFRSHFNGIYSIFCNVFCLKKKSFDRYFLWMFFFIMSSEKHQEISLVFFF